MPQWGWGRGSTWPKKDEAWGRESVSPGTQPWEKEMKTRLRAAGASDVHERLLWRLVEAQGVAVEEAEVSVREAERLGMVREVGCTERFAGAGWGKVHKGILGVG